MKHAQIHALILGGAFLLSVVIIAGRVSLAGRSRDPREAGQRVVEDAGNREEAVEEEDLTDKVTRYLAEAEDLLKSSAGVEGREGEIQQVLKILGEAQGILENLPKENPRVKDLNIRCGQLRQDASRASGF